MIDLAKLKEEHFHVTKELTETKLKYREESDAKQEFQHVLNSR